MRLTLVSLAAAAVLAGATASAQAPNPITPELPQPPLTAFVAGTPSNYASSPFRGPEARKQCFNGGSIAGSNRADDRTVYVQPTSGGVFRLELADACSALNAAKSLAVRADGGDSWACSGEAATLMLKTAAGPKRCVIDKVQRLTSTEVADLATNAKR